MRTRFALLVASVVAFVMLMPAAATAQEERRFEAFGGFSYLFADVGGSGLGLDDVGGAGFTGEFAFFLNDWLGLGAEVGYNRGGLDLPTIFIVPTPDVDFSQWTVVFGPRFRLAATDRFRLGAQAMVGMASGRTGVDFDGQELFIDLPGQGRRRFTLPAFDFNINQTTFAATLGIHFDLRINDRLIWRVVQPDVLVTGYGSDAQTHFRFATGLGFEF